MKYKYTLTSPILREQIEKKWKQIVAQYPVLEKEWTHFWEFDVLDKESVSDSLHLQEEILWLKAVYTACSVHDWISSRPQEMYRYVQASRRMTEELAYVKQVPEPYFFAYVLAPRVNNEYLDGSRMWLYESLCNRVAGKTMKEAALEVNLWCYEKATYTPSDDRTISPYGICKRAKGRCGEESVFLVSALRAVGIPARQCYAPRWAHCDDNHAWVEVWADGDWHYMGACEPEPVLDKGWFTAAASKALLVRTREPDFSQSFAENPSGYRLVNCTSRYGETKELCVQVLQGGKPKKDAKVQFQLINYSELFTLYEEKTDADGKAHMEFGIGDLYVSALADGTLVGTNVDLRQTSQLCLELEDGICPAMLYQEREEKFDLVPPVEVVALNRDEKMTYDLEPEKYQKRLKECEKIREQYESGFANYEPQWSEDSKWLALACGNQEEMVRFLETSSFEAEKKEKELLLETLREKDFVDITEKRLSAYMKAAYPWKEKYPQDIWQQGILAPRVENEMILDIRESIQALLIKELAVSSISLISADRIVKWMKEHIRTVPEFGLEDRSVDYERCVLHQVCPESKWQALFVQICRALGIAARLHPVTAQAEVWNLESELWEYVQPEGKEEPEVQLTISCTEEEPLRYGEQLTIGCWNGEDYDTLDYHGREFQGYTSLKLKCGSYRIITTRRQIDGSVSSWMKYFSVKEDRYLEVNVREDQMRQKLKQEKLPDGICSKHSSQKSDSQKSELPMLLIYAEPGKEPTEHLFQELLELKQEWNQKGYPIQVILSSEEQQKNQTLQKVLKELENSFILISEDEEQRKQVLACMGVGDERLPLAVAVGAEGMGRFAFANYNIRTAHTLLRILNVEYK